ncbi:mucin-22-like [Galleria mellonella]|uniref:Mucin-22-like n=1 Tax=Galleria mellonella TaxID=7137 RepID=A0ABM3N591_GALME|nr:mucin-22-like [Galleria mellonella]
MDWFSGFLIILLTSSYAYCDECYVDSFEDISSTLASNVGVCSGLPAWNYGKYSQINIESQHENSLSFISPPSVSIGFACVLTPTFRMAAAGVLQFNVFSQITISTDLITIVAYEGESGTTDRNIVGQVSISSNAGLNRGWNIINVTLDGSESFNGYVSFVGRASLSSILLVDSFRYIPAEYTTDSDYCEIYEDGASDTTTTDTTTTNTTTTETTTISTTTTEISWTETTTTDSTTTTTETPRTETTTGTTTTETTTISTTTTEIPWTETTTTDSTTTVTTTTETPQTETTTTESTTVDTTTTTITQTETTTVTQENDVCIVYNFDNKFEQLFSDPVNRCNGIEASWKLFILGITPSENGVFNCLTSNPFKVNSGGILKINFYATSYFQLAVVVEEYIENGIGFVLGSETLSSSDTEVGLNVQTMELRLWGEESRLGHIIIVGKSSTDLSLIVESFQYIPPSGNEDNCIPFDEYEKREKDKSFFILIIILLIAFDLVTVLTMDRFGSFIILLTSFFAYGDKYYIDSNVGVCSEILHWNDEKYSQINVESQAGSNFSYIFLPSESIGFTCGLTPTFHMAAKGVLQFNVFAQPTVSTDLIRIVVYEGESESADRNVVGQVSINSNSDLNRGWNVINITLDGSTTFRGYVAFLGKAVPNSILLVDSFRYIPPQYLSEEDYCEFYEDDASSTTTTVTTTTESTSSESTCYVDSFEDTSNALASNVGVCSGLPNWSFGKYSQINVDSLHENSFSYIFPPSVSIGFACILTSTFHMATRGVLQFNVFAQPTASTDLIRVVAYEGESESADRNVVGQVSINSNSDLNRGWNVINITLDGSATFRGYVAFLGKAVPNSILLVDSFRYIPPQYLSEEDYCEFYEDDASSTTTTVTTTTESTSSESTCYVDSFEDTSNTLASNVGVCSGLPNWSFGKYSQINVDSLHENSFSYIFPPSVSIGFACILTSTFHMATRGVLQFNVFAQPTASTDLIRVVAYEGESESADRNVVGQVSVNSNSDLNRGWNVINITLDGSATFRGYVAFLGKAVPNSILLVDSFRYIPPQYLSEEDYCEFYEDDASSTTTTVTTTTESTSSESTCYVDSFEDTSNTLASNVGVCSGLPNWSFGKYSQINVDSLHENSFSYIFPPSVSIGFACILTSTFHMATRGVLQFNVFAQPTASTDLIRVVAYEGESESADRNVVGQVSINSNSDLNRGWNVINITLDGSATFRGYIAFLGKASSNSFLLVDSFRYIPPQYQTEADNCKIYGNDIIDTTSDTTTEITTDTVTSEISSTKTTTTETPQTEVTMTDTTTTETSLTETITDATSTDTIITITETSWTETITTDPTTTTSIVTISDTQTEITTIESTTVDTTITTAITSTETTTVTQESDICIVYNFDNKFEHLFSDPANRCSDIEASWKFHIFGIIPSENGVSNCITSNPFKVNSGGILKINFYATSDFQLAVFVEEYIENDIAFDLGSKILSSSDIEVDLNVQTIELTLKGEKSLLGHFRLVGKSSNNLSLMVESFQYIPPSGNEDNCITFDEYSKREKH